MIILFCSSMIMIFSLLDVSQSASSFPSKQTITQIYIDHMNILDNQVPQNANYNGALQSYQYKMNFNITFSIQPQVALGVYAFSLNPYYFDSYTGFYEMNVQNSYPTYFYLQLKINTSQFVFKDIRIFYFAADLSKTLEIVAIQYVAVNSTYLKFQQFNMTSWRYHNITQSLNKPVNKTWRVKYIVNIVGHHFIENNFSSIDVWAYSTGSTTYQLKIGVYNYTKLSFAACYIIAIDQDRAESKLRYYQHQNTQYGQDSINIMNQFTTNVGRIYVSFSLFYGNNTSSSSVGFIFSYYNNLKGYVKLLHSGTIVRLNILEPYILQCNSTQYFDPLSKLCLDNCTLYSSSPYQRVCNSCILNCAQCGRPGHCLQCVKTRSHIGTYYNCPCESALYYETGKEFCELCSVPIFGCAKCTNYDNCTLCDQKLQMNPKVKDNTTCECQQKREFNQSRICVCIFGHFDDNGTCKKCHYSCVTCDGPTQQYCTSCRPNVFRTFQNRTCRCDTEWRFMQLCDTPRWDCDPSICYLDPEIQLTLTITNLTKDPNKNILYFSIVFNPNLQFLNYFDFNNSIKTGLPLGTNTTLKYSNGVITVQSQYYQNLQGKEIQLQLALQLISPSLSKVPNITQKYSIYSTNNLASNVYSQEQYQMKDRFKYVTMVLIGLSFAVFAIGSYSSKIVVTEMMGIVQVSFLGLMTLNYHDPIVSSLSFLKYSNGFNDILPLENILPNRIYLLGYSYFVVDNFNIPALIMIIPFFVGLIILIISQIKRRGKLTLVSYFKLCIGEWTMFFIFFSLINFSTSATLFLKYFMTGTKSFLSIGEISAVFVFISANLILFGFTDYNYFGQFKCMFKWNKFQLNYYYFHVFIRIVSGVLIGVMNSTYISGAIISGLYFLLSLLTIVQRPYADIFQSIRSTLNLLIGSIIFMLYTLIQYKGSTSGNNFYSRIPIAINMLLYLVVLIGLGFTIKQFIKMNQKQKISQPQGSTYQLQRQKHNELMKKKIQQQLQKGTNDNSFAKKLFLSKNKKPKKKKKSIAITLDFNSHTDSIETKKNSNIKMNHQNLLDQSDTGLTLSRIKMVDAMLKEGLI